MTDKIMLDQYKEMIEKTKQLHSELVELSSKMGGIVDTIDAELPFSVVTESSTSVDVSIKHSNDLSGSGDSIPRLNRRSTDEH